LKRRAREDAKREAQNEKALNEYKATLGPFVERLIAADVARDLWQALTVRGPCGGKEGHAFWLVAPLVEAIEEALERALGIEKTEPELVPAVEPITPDDDGLDIPECLRRAP
jgi:hypothetical protein